MIKDGLRFASIVIAISVLIRILIRRLFRCLRSSYDLVSSLVFYRRRRVGSR